MKRDLDMTSHNSVTPRDTHSGKAAETAGLAPFFTVTEDVTFTSMKTAEKEAVSLPPRMIRLVSVISLSAALLWPLTGCSDYGESDLPCAVPTATSTPVPDGTPTAKCRSHNGRNYIWIRSRGGWVESNDGVHPKQGASGIGADDEHSGGRSGVGDGRSGSGHGGSEGG
jgi:hypothetical protein